MVTSRLMDRLSSTASTSSTDQSRWLFMCGYRASGCEWIIARHVSTQCMGFLCVFLAVFNGCHWAPAAGWAQVGDDSGLQTCQQTAALTCRSHQEGWSENGYFCVELFQFIGCFLPKSSIWQIVLDLVIQLLCKPQTLSHGERKDFCIIFFRVWGVVSW